MTEQNADSVRAIERMWCRALVEEIPEQPDIIQRITVNYLRQRNEQIDSSGGAL